MPVGCQSVAASIGLRSRLRRGRFRASCGDPGEDRGSAGFCRTFSVGKDVNTGVRVPHHERRVASPSPIRLCGTTHVVRKLHVLFRVCAARGSALRRSGALSRCRMPGGAREDAGGGCDEARAAEKLLMSSRRTFRFETAAILTRLTNRRARNLRELRDGLAIATRGALEGKAGRHAPRRRDPPPGAPWSDRSHGPLD